MKIIKSASCGKRFLLPISLYFLFSSSAHCPCPFARPESSCIHAFCLLRVTISTIGKKTHRGIAVPSLHSFESPFSKGQGKERTKKHRRSGAFVFIG
jgi:hypothetical protein